MTTRDVSTKTGGPQPIYIKNISKDGPAFKDGRLKLGDRLLKVSDWSKIEGTGNLAMARHS